MIKLEDLKKGDIVYLVHNHYWLNKVKVIQEKTKQYNEIYVTVQLKDCKMCLTKIDEDRLFKEKEEAINYKNKKRKERKEFLSTKQGLLFLIKEIDSHLPSGDIEILEEIYEEEGI